MSVRESDCPGNVCKATKIYSSRFACSRYGQYSRASVLQLDGDQLAQKTFNIIYVYNSMVWTL